MIKKIVVIGPESTGKSTLCTQLAAHFNTSWVPEYARKYLDEHGTGYLFDDLINIAAGQIKNEDEISFALEPESISYSGDGDNQLKYLFIDTDLYVIKVWSEFVFNKCDNRILTQIAKRAYDLYLLCNTDVPWIPDALREYPDLYTREKLFHFYKDAMVNQQVPWIEVAGNYNERLLSSIEAVNKIQ